MKTATRTTPTGKKMHFYLLENFAIIQMYSVYPAVLELASAEYAKKSFNSKYQSQKLSVVVQVVSNKLNLVISRCCSAKNGYERQWTASLKTQHLIEKNIWMSTVVYIVWAKHEPHVLVSTGAVLYIYFFQLPSHFRSQSLRFFVRSGTCVKKYKTLESWIKYNLA